MVMDEVTSSSPSEVQAVRTLAEYLHHPSKRSEVTNPKVVTEKMLQFSVPSLSGDLVYIHSLPLLGRPF